MGPVDHLGRPFDLNPRQPAGLVEAQHHTRGHLPGVDTRPLRQIDAQGVGWRMIVESHVGSTSRVKGPSRYAPNTLHRQENNHPDTAGALVIRTFVRIYSRLHEHTFVHRAEK
jgi:hypothetical protein